MKKRNTEASQPELLGSPETLDVTGNPELQKLIKAVNRQKGKQNGRVIYYPSQEELFIIR